jgi:hypothetical protein
MAPAEEPLLRVQVAWAPGPRETRLVSLALPPGSCVDDALRASGAPAGHDLGLAVWGRSVPGSTPLRDRDRVEVLRPLQVDPKEARRLRYRSQAERAPRGRRGAGG